MLTERENRSGKYWPEVVAVQTESQYSVTLGYGFGKQIHDFDRVQNPTKKEPMTLEFTLRLPSNIIAELRAEPHTHIEKAKETHKLIFSWLSWLAALLVGAYARRRSRARWQLG